MAKDIDVRAVLKQHFDEADVEKKGYLTIPQTKAVLEKALEFTLEDRLTTRIIELCDVDHSGNINFEEFCTSAKALVEALRSVVSEFHRMDLDGSGFLGPDEIAHMLNMGCCGGLQQDDRLVQAFIMDCDKDGDGRVSFHEFLYFMSGELLRKQGKKKR